MMLEAFERPAPKFYIDLSRYRDRLRLPTAPFVVEYTQIAEVRADRPSQIADGGEVWPGGFSIESAFTKQNSVRGAFAEDPKGSSVQ